MTDFSILGDDVVQIVEFIYKELKEIDAMTSLDSDTLEYCERLKKSYYKIKNAAEKYQIANIIKELEDMGFTS